MNEKIQSIIEKYQGDRGRLLDMLLDIQAQYQHIPAEAVNTIADRLDISQVDVEQVVSFYHFLTTSPAGKYAVYLNDSVVAKMMGRDEVAAAFEAETGILFNSVTPDGLIGLWDTADIGMNDQEPAAIINGTVFTKLTPDKVKKLVGGFQVGKSIATMVAEHGEGVRGPKLMRTMIRRNIRQRGAIIIYDNYEFGRALQKVVTQTPEAVIAELQRSNLRGRGGAGFPTGLKWHFCRQANNDGEAYIICNADEGEPGTFKDRVLLSELPRMVFEGMLIAGYAVGAKQGIVYLRNEYRYMRPYLEIILQEMQVLNQLGKNIAGKEGFDFDIRIQLGAGSYVCGAESALIESLEGKRGEPRNRPPFPVQKGYKDKPTVVNNVETLCKAVSVIDNGADWFMSFGTTESSGTKLLSISGDCKRPGIYEVEWGVTVEALLRRAGATDVQAVQVGGPSGTCIDPSQFNRQISFEDLATGGAVIIIGEQRDLLRDFVLEYMNFFIAESCSSCAPCRALTVILRNKLLKILDGHGTKQDIDELYTWAGYNRVANRCGLGQTAANPIITTIENFYNLYENLIKTDETYVSAFNMEQAVAEACEAVGRVPNLHSD